MGLSARYQRVSSMQLEPKPEAPPVVGVDGELLEPDTAVDINDYADYVARHVRRDPWRVRLREHVMEWGCLYVMVIPIGFSVGITFLYFFSLGYIPNRDMLLVFCLVTALIGYFVWFIRYHDDRQ